MTVEILAGLPSARLLARVRDLVKRGNEAEAELLAHLGEVDARRLYLEEGCSSMFVWCQRALHFAEGVAYKRIQAARAARQFPEILEAVRRGDLHLTAVGLLAPKLTVSNCAELIKAACHRSADEIRRMLADREPKPAAPAFVRRIPESRKVIEPPALPRATLVAPPPPLSPPPARARTEPLGAERYTVQFTVDRETHAQLEELRALMRHQVPDGDVGKVRPSTQAEVCRERSFQALVLFAPAERAAVTTCPRRNSPSCLGARCRPLYVRLCGRHALRLTGVRRVRSRRCLDMDEDAFDRGHHASLPSPQPAASSPRLRGTTHGPICQPNWI